jgi:acyl-CoA reductase-like NAD-dependent aldehyde dehydrogenase
MIAAYSSLDEFYPPGTERSLIGDTFDFASGIRNARDYERLTKIVEKAHEDGKLVYRGETDVTRNRMGINLVRLNRNGEGETGTLVTDEIYGPIIPIIPVDVSVPLC